MVKILSNDGKEFETVEDAKAYEEAQNSPARTIIFDAHSDDIVMITGYNGRRPTDIEEFYGKEYILRHADDGTMLITAVYNGCWSFAPGQFDEDVEMPEWRIKFKVDGYVTQLHVDVPAGTMFQEKK